MAARQERGKLGVPRGTQDVLPDGWRMRYAVLDIVRSTFGRYGYQRITTPTFEHTELFSRGVGEGTDIVRKEMYTFPDRSDRSLTLRPEGTAPVARAFIEHGMHREPLPVKLWYFAPMFRYEAPQKGRYREHYQIGAEVIGSSHPAVDAELIAMLAEVYSQLRIPDVKLRLNTIGDDACRPAYRTMLAEFLEIHRDELCDDCKERIATNPLRTFDCKQRSCRDAMELAPVQRDHLCGECEKHFSTVRTLLDAAGVEYELDAALVRGLDYYTRTTFEFTCMRLGAQDGVGGGGRYDGLVEALGGPSTPAVGFGSGIERIVLALESADVPPLRDDEVDVYVCVEHDAAWPEMFRLMIELRARGLRVETDFAGRSLKGQLKQASRLGAPLAVIARTGGDLAVHFMHGRREEALGKGVMADSVLVAFEQAKVLRGEPM